MNTIAKSCFIVLLASFFSPTSLATAGEDHSIQTDMIGYEFETWGGKKRTTFATFHWNLDLARLLGDNYSVVSRFGRKQTLQGTWAAYDEVSFIRRKDAGARPDGDDVEPVVYKVRYSECKNLALAHRTLISTMLAGSAPAPPNRTIHGVDVGDKCFTGWAQEIPTSIFFARGNVVVAITGRDSVLPIAIEIDKKLTEGFPQAKRPSAVTFPPSNGEKEGFVLPVAPNITRVVELPDGKDVSTSVWSSSGELRLAEDRSVVLTGVTGGDVEVIVIQAHRMRFRQHEAISQDAIE